MIMPYAYGADIVWYYSDTTLSFRITFRHPMDTLSTPNPSTFNFVIDGEEYYGDSCEWLDDFSLQVIVINVPSYPSSVFCSYEGPDANLVTSWGKQWEPWSKIPCSDFAGSFIPSGCIFIWSGLEADIPTGFHICDGTNGTPNLRSRFIICESDVAGFQHGQSGGDTSHTHTASQSAHQHGLLSGYGLAAGTNVQPVTTSSTPSVTVVAATHLPPFYALCYIMKL
jgi:hypothetical protein